MVEEVQAEWNSTFEDSNFFLHKAEVSSTSVVELGVELDLGQRMCAHRRVATRAGRAHQQ